jgi:hypothetical protein
MYPTIDQIMASACPLCDAPPGQPCRKSRYAKQPREACHKQRIAAAWTLCRAEAAPKDTDPSVYSVAEFAHRNAISTGMVYRLWRDGQGPDSMMVGTRRLITREAELAWQQARAARSASDARDRSVSDARDRSVTRPPYEELPPTPWVVWDAQADAMRCTRCDERYPLGLFVGRRLRFVAEIMHAFVLCHTTCTEADNGRDDQRTVAR